jgi:hypothetical protein
LLLFGNSGPRGEGFLATVRHGLDLPPSTLRGLLLCWAGFLVPHVIAFVQHIREGAYDDLISVGALSEYQWRQIAVLPRAGGGCR